MVLHSSAHMNQAEMVWPRADGMAEIAHNVNRRYRYIKEAGIPYRVRTTVFQIHLLITRVSALSSAQQDGWQAGGSDRPRSRAWTCGDVDFVTCRADR